MKHYLIYQIQNKLNGMIYIGKHVTTDLNDDYMGSGLRIQRAIKKYGIENFKKTILFECNSEEEMNAKEAEIVNEDFIARDDVYNIKLGGEGGWDYCNKKENHNNLRNHRKTGFVMLDENGQNAGMRSISLYTAQQHDEFCKKISNSVKRHIEEYGSRWSGKHHSEETKVKMKDFHAKNHPQAGEKNSQYGMIAIYNEETFERATIKKDQPIPNGWAKGRFYNATPEELKQRKKLVEQILKLDPNSKATIRMPLVKLQRIYEKILHPKLHIEKQFLDSELRRLQKEQTIKEKIELLNKQYEFYKEHSWDEFVKKFDYQYSYPNFVQQCQRYVKSFVPQNGKKRRTK